MNEVEANVAEGRQPGPGEVGYVPPSETVPLPSKGMIYPKESPLFGSEFIEIRSMTARDEDILTSKALLKQGKAISVLLKNCLIDKSLEPDLMVAGDRNAILVAIRITGYGPEYEVGVECPSCGKKSDFAFDLSSLPVKPLGVQPIVAGTNEFSFTLPMSKKEVTFKLLNGIDEQDLSAMMDQVKRMGNPIDSAMTTRLAMQIVSFAGEKDRNKIGSLVKNLLARDSRALRQYIDKISPGISMVQMFTCVKCEESSEVDVPMGTEFFWPSK